SSMDFCIWDPISSKESPPSPWPSEPPAPVPPPLATEPAGFGLGWGMGPGGKVGVESPLVTRVGEKEVSSKGPRGRSRRSSPPWGSKPEGGRFLTTGRSESGEVPGKDEVVDRRG